MHKPDYSDLEAAESIGHIFGFLGPFLLVIVAIAAGGWLLLRLFF